MSRARKNKKDGVIMKYDKNALVMQACDAREGAYSPYSGFCVGAALLCKDGRVYEGANVENASYGAANCAERTAFFKAVTDGERDFSAIAIVGAKRGEAVTAFCAPCGICRQVMAEFCAPDFEILLYDGKSIKTFALAELLPEAFNKDNL